MQLQGIVKGKQIELERETGLPSGAVVTVSIEAMPLTLTDKRRLVDLLCGAWANDSTIPTVFAEIERQRASATPRGANFDAAS